MKRIASCAGFAALTMMAAAQANQDLIVPGRQLGKVFLGEAKTWPRSPNYSDTASGHRWQTWEALKPDPRNGMITNSLDIYSSVNAGGQYRVRLIRSTSPTFATQDKVRVGSPFGEVLRKYIHIARVADYELQQYSEKAVLYDDEALGIAFEFAANPDGTVAHKARCLSIWVHEPGLKLMQEYYNPVQYLTAKPALRRAAKHKREA